MPRLTITILVVLAAGAASAQANCKLPENEVVRDREKRCTANVIKVTCDGVPVDIVAHGRTCCEAPEDRVIEWRCGGELEPELFCPGDATALLVNPTSDGARFRCLSILEVDEALPVTETDTEGAPVSQPPLSLSGQSGS